MKKYIYPILFAISGAMVFGIIGFLKFLNYGGNRCDTTGKICDCFCCHSFGLRGYEACADYGLLVGSIIGVIVGITIYLLIKKYKKL